jgi:hypothetical protein
MNKEKSDLIHELCSRIAVEQDHKRFLILVEELNRLLSTDAHNSRAETPERKIPEPKLIGKGQIAENEKS